MSDCLTVLRRGNILTPEQNVTQETNKRPLSYVDKDQVRSALSCVLDKFGAPCQGDDVNVIASRTSLGHTVHVVIASKRIERVLALLVRKEAGRRRVNVGVPGVFLLRPDDVQQLVLMIDRLRGA